MGRIVATDNVTLDGVVQDPAGDEGFRVGGWVGLIPIATSIVIAGAGTLLFRRQLDQLRARQRYDELSQGLRRVHRRSTEEELPVS